MDQVFTIGQLVQAAEQESLRQREASQMQTKVASAPKSVDVDLLDTNTVMVLAKIGRDLAARMKIAEDEAGGMEGSSGLNTGSASGNMKDSLTPSAEHADQFYVQPKGEVDVSSAKNPMSIPTSTDAKPGEGTMTSGPSKPSEFLAPKIGHSLFDRIQGMGSSYATGDQVGTGRDSLKNRTGGTPDAEKKTDIAPDPGLTAGREGTASGFDPVRAVHDRYVRAAAQLSKSAQSPGSIPDQVDTKTDPLVGPAKPESASTSGDVNAPKGDKPPTTEEGVSDLTRQETHTDAVGEAASETGLPAAAAKDSTEGVLNEVLKAASTNATKAAAFRAWFNSLPPNSKIAQMLNNKLASLGKGVPAPRPAAGVRSQLGKSARDLRPHTPQLPQAREAVMDLGTSSGSSLTTTEPGASSGAETEETKANKQQAQQPAGQ